MKNKFNRFRDTDDEFLKPSRSRRFETRKTRRQDWEESEWSHDVPRRQREHFTRRNKDKKQ